MDAGLGGPYGTVLWVKASKAGYTHVRLPKFKLDLSEQPPWRLCRNASHCRR